MANNPNINNHAREATVLLLAIVLPPVSERSDVEGPTLGPGHSCGADHERVAIPELVDAQIREGCDAVDSRYGLRAGERTWREHAAVAPDGDGHRPVESR